MVKHTHRTHIYTPWRFQGILEAGRRRGGEAASHAMYAYRSARYGAYYGVLAIGSSAGAVAADSVGESPFAVATCCLAAGVLAACTVIKYGNMVSSLARSEEAAAPRPPQMRQPPIPPSPG